MSRLRRDAGTRKRVITRLMLDGEELTPERETEFAQRPASEFQLFEAELVAPEELVRQVLEGLAQALPALSEETRGAARAVRSGAPAAPRIVEIAKALGLILSGYQDGARLLASCGGQPGHPEAGAALASVLEEVLAALRERDSVRLCDALEHELVPGLELLETELRQRAELLGGASSPLERPRSGHPASGPAAPGQESRVRT